ncbi:MAG TPA: HNH endonuclease signature motif containing protein [Chthoniobacterales bacterium]
MRRRVIERAGRRCEYCGLSQTGQEAAFHLDHVVPVAAGRKTGEENLALACVSCSLRKGARLQAPDPQTGEAVVLFHPRRDPWHLHFRWHRVEVIGLTPTGRATVAALQMNRPLAWAIRKEETFHRRHPPPGRQSEPG